MTAQTEMELPSTGERFLTCYTDESLAEHLHRYSIALSLSAGKDVLDIASGEGYGSNLLASVAKHVVGIDVAADAIKHASEKYQRPNLRFLHGSASRMPIDSASIDVAVSFETIEHHTEHEAMLLELRRVLRPNGLLIISTPEKLNYTDRREVKNAYHVKELYLKEFRDLISRHFGNTAIYFQQMSYCSLVSPESNASGMEFVQGDLTGFNRVTSMPTPLYNICLASAIQLPMLPVSIFSTSIDCSYAVQERQERIEVLEQRLRNISTTLRDLESSASFRLGRVFTAPFRWIANKHTRAT